MQYKQSTSVCFHVCFWDISRKHLHRLVGAESLRFLPFLNQQMQQEPFQNWNPFSFVSVQAQLQLLSGQNSDRKLDEAHLREVTGSSLDL